MAAPHEQRSQVVILGAGRGVRGGVPSAIVDIDEKGRVMDWLLDAFAELGDPELCFVGGFKADEVVERYPKVRTVFNRDWAHTGPVQSLGLVTLDPSRDAYVCYADVVFRRSAVAALRDAGGDVVLAVDTHWRDRYEGRGQRVLDQAEKVLLAASDAEDHRAVQAIGPQVATAEASAEFAGLLCLRGAAVEAAFGAIRSGILPPSATIPDLVRHLLGLGLEVTGVDLKGEWAELDAKQDLARFVLGTKAESLDRLRKMSHGGEIGELVAFTFADWRDRPEEMLDRVFSEIPGESLIVRSSALAEDSWYQSAAGAHESVLDVPRERSALAQAISTVFASYREAHDDNQVLVQEMLRDVAMSGVVMTRTHATSAPYYVINFDDTTTRTDTVTGGADARTVFVHRGATVRDELPAALGSVLSTVQNIEKLVGHDSLDIEFAVTQDQRVHILQVRPIAVTHVPEPIDDEQVSAALGDARRFLTTRRPPPPTLVGSTTRYSVMTDWNPAEIIGTKPKRLALSLYRYLITDEVWARQRAEYGYRDVRPCPLIVDIVGHPYVDVRATFNSFVPAALSDSLAHRLVDHYLGYLAEHPHLHDKVEFDVLFTCLTVDFDQQTERLRVNGFDDVEIELLRDALRAITERGIARIDGDLAKLPLLEARFARIDEADLSPLDRAYHYLEETRRTGTLAFAHLARAGFVASALLRSLQNVGVLSAEEVNSFLGSIETVLGRMQSDGRRVRTGELSWDDFVAVYGHLRPGTYDITSPCYRSAAEQYLRPVVERAGAVSERDAGSAWEGWTASTRSAVTEALGSVGLGVDAEQFELFARKAIAGREEGKFVFTKGLSAALECLAAFGETHGLTRSDLAHIPVTDLLACREVVIQSDAFLDRRILEGKEAFNIAHGVCLPGQIASEADLFCFEQEAAEPNFVSLGAVEAPVVAYDLSPASEVDGKIVLIPNADPGFDWLLARDIAGLITMYGGANSHMAVRAAELGLPAAIGVGELLYSTLEGATVIRLDCASRTVTVVC